MSELPALEKPGSRPFPPCTIAPPGVRPRRAGSKTTCPAGSTAYAGPTVSAATPPKVVVRNLRKTYDGVEAVQGASFTLGAGEIFGLLGPNGAGKTTTVECLVGLRTPDAGDIEICGLDARRQPRAVKERIGVALQTTALPDKLTPREALRLFGAFYRRRLDPASVLGRFGLTEKADAGFETLSGGQRQRLALALAFQHEPELVVLDEPTTGLDPLSRRELHALIARLKADGCTILLTTHQLTEAEALCDRVAIIDRGKIVATGTPGELAAQARGLHAVVFRVRTPLAAAQLAALPAASAITGQATDWRLRTSDPAATLAALMALLTASRTELLDLQVQRGSLEEVFLALTQEAPA
jgi:ABC-2 type transport system ATP-binding protein